MEDVDKWKELYLSGMSFDKIANLYGKSYKIVRGRLLKAGLVPRVMSRVFSKEEIDDVLLQYQSKVSAQKLAKKYGVTISRIKRIILENGVEWDNEPTNYKFKTGGEINRECFKDFTTEQELYFFGLLLADGCILKNSNAIQIALQEQDLNILEKFCSFLGINRQPKAMKRQVGYRFGFSDKVIADKLREVGLESAKSLREKPPNFYNCDDINMRHFWRGFVDGDGSVHSLLSYKSRGVRLIGTIEMLSAFEEYCRKFCNLQEKQINQNKRVNKNCYEIQYTGIDASKIAKLLYEDSTVSLDRKKIQADHLATMSEIQRPVPRRKKKLT